MYPKATVGNSRIGMLEELKIHITGRVYRFRTHCNDQGQWFIGVSGDATTSQRFGRLFPDLGSSSRIPAQVSCLVLVQAKRPVPEVGN